MMDVEIPANTRATVYIPAKTADAVNEGGELLSAVKDIKVKGVEDGYVVLEMGSGKYHFTAAK
jgi:alpha-L-rhamnosidase